MCVYGLLKMGHIYMSCIRYQTRKNIYKILVREEKASHRRLYNTVPS